MFPLASHIFIIYPRQPLKKRIIIYVSFGISHFYYIPTSTFKKKRIIIDVSFGISHFYYIPTSTFKKKNYNLCFLWHLTFLLYTHINFWGCPRGVMVNAMDCGIVVREFILQLRYYIHFRANTLGKGMNPLPAMG